MPISTISTGGIADSINIDNGTLVVDGVNNRVGIGTASPATALTIASEGKLRLYRADNARYGDIYNDNSFLNIETSNDPIKISGQTYIRFDTDGSEAMRISGGNVGIGTTSPAATLHITDSDTSVNGTMRFGSNSTYYAYIKKTYSTDKFDIGTNGSGQHISFTNNGTERMRIDSSGNLLVGKTSTAVNTQGIQLGADGRFYATSDGAESAVFNRKTSDGVIASFRKDNTTVGSIRSISGPQIAIGGSTDGIAFYSGGNQIYPCNMSTGSDRDATIDLGYGSSRWKDLYLSGGVLLGGTGSANYLEDYEEGTWTPQIWKNTTQVTSPVSALGVYRKIGNVIFYSFYFYKSSGSNTDNNEWTLKGMPFSMEAGGNGAYVSLTSDYTGINGVNYFNQSGSHRWQANGNAYFSLYGPQSTTQWTTGYLEFSGSGFVYAL